MLFSAIDLDCISKLGITIFSSTTNARISKGKLMTYTLFLKSARNSSCLLQNAVHLFSAVKILQLSLRMIITTKTEVFAVLTRHFKSGFADFFYEQIHHIKLTPLSNYGFILHICSIFFFSRIFRCRINGKLSIILS